MINESRSKEENEEKLISKIRYLKQKYSPEELRSIISQFKDPINKIIAEKLLEV